MPPTPNGTDVLVFGATGRLGTALVRLLPGFGLSVTGRSGRGAEQLAAGVEAVVPRVVVYAAAIADPDACERDPDASHRVNVAGPAAVAATAARLGCRVVYYSSDYVFGPPGRYFEDAPVSPLQVYGRHKVAAERLLLERGDNIVIRLPLLFGARDFVADAVAAITRGTPLAMDERTRFPISVDHVAAITATLLREEAPAGIYHAVGTDAVTKADWARYIADLLDQPVPPVAPAKPAVAARPVDIELATRHTGMATSPGALWAATRARVAELSDAQDP